MFVRPANLMGACAVWLHAYVGLFGSVKFGIRHTHPRPQKLKYRITSGFHGNAVHTASPLGN
jgi:hypothetical protein